MLSKVKNRFTKIFLGLSVVFVNSEILEKNGCAEFVPENHEKARSIVSAGSAARGAEISIVNPTTKEKLPDLEVGEIWVS